MTASAAPAARAGLVVRGLRVERGDRVLFSGLDFDAPPGTLVHLAGANGSGKTTLLKTLAGLVSADAGTIAWHGSQLDDGRAFRAALNYVGHLPGLNAELTPRENLEFIAALCAAPRRTDTGAALATLDCRAFADRPVRYLSAGQRQRVALARLVLFAAEVWMLDEPFTALDQASRTRVEALIDGHLDEGGTVLIATHQAFASRHPVCAVNVAARRH